MSCSNGSPFDDRGKENMFMMDLKSQKPPNGKTKYRFVLIFIFGIAGILNYVTMAFFAAKFQTFHLFYVSVTCSGSVQCCKLKFCLLVIKVTVE